MIVLQASDRGCIYDVSSTLQFCGIDYLIWNPAKISIKEMYQQCNPDLLVVTEDFCRATFDELVESKEAANNTNKIAVLNMDILGTEFIGYRWPASINLISNLNVPHDDKYQTDVSILVSKEDSEDFREIFIEITKRIPLDYTCRIYDDFNHSAAIGAAGQLDYPLICKNSHWVIDLRGEYGYNAILHGNKCHTDVTFLDIDHLIKNIIENTMPEYPPINDNFTNTRLILEKAKMNDLADIVSQKGLMFYEKYWATNQRTRKHRLGSSCGGI